MKAHLLKTTDFSQELYDEILAFLSQFNSPIKFVRAETVSKCELKNKFLFQDAYNHCKSYRMANEIPATDVVVILTSKPEFNDWFSHYDLEGNICVVNHQVKNSLNLIDEKYFCAYEIVCNILQNKGFNHCAETYGGFLADESAEILRKFFLKKRIRKIN